MRYLTVEEIILIHEYEIQITGGTYEILSLELLESACYRPKTTIGGKEMYDDIFKKASCLIHSLIKNHPFVDGSKRTAVVSCVAFLSLNGYELTLNDEKLVKLTKYVESGKFSVSQISLELKNNTKRVE